SSRRSPLSGLYQGLRAQAVGRARLRFGHSALCPSLDRNHDDESNARNDQNYQSSRDQLVTSHNSTTESSSKCHRQTTDGEQPAGGPRLKPRNRTAAHTVAAPDVRQCLPSLSPGLGLGNLMRRQLGLPPEPNPPSHRPASPFACPRKNERTLEFPAILRLM